MNPIELWRRLRPLLYLFEGLLGLDGMLKMLLSALAISLIELGGLAFDMVLYCIQHALLVVRMDQRAPFIDVATEIFVGESEHAFPPLAIEHRAGMDVPVPQAITGALDRVAPARLGLVARFTLGDQRIAHSFDLGDGRAGGDDHQGDGDLPAEAV